MSSLSVIGWGALAFSFATLLSRLTGLFRDVVLAHYFGASGLLDAYFLAILVPFYLRRIFAEGAMASAFVPVYAETHRKNENEAPYFASAVSNIVLISTFFVSVILMVFPRPFLKLFATGFTEQILNLSASTLQITAFYILLVSLSAIFSSIANFYGRFFLPALAPMFINISVIFAAFFASRSQNVRLLGAGFLLGGMFQFMLSFYSAKRNFRFYPILKHEKLRDFFRLFFTASVGYAVTHINSIVDTNVATWLGAGAVSSLQYSLRLFQLPLGLFGVAVSTAALPSFSKNLERLDRSMGEALELLWFLIFPSSIAMAIMSRSLVFLIFQHGSFDLATTELVSRCLFMYSLGIPFYATYLLLSRYYHAQQKGGVTSVVTLIMVIVNVSLDLILAPIMGIAGVALATSVAGAVGTLIIWYLISKRIGRVFINLQELRKLLFINIPVFILSVVAAECASTRVLILAFVVVIVLLYLLVAKLLRLRSLESLMIFLKKR
ncbi:MAG: putative peptidoglycan lipid flippase [Thermotogota bacterium]|nr:putative peptidoglycan lipid flippase [Thermotogota bacterium]MDK2865374.1 putative peptidoglycan lipid flippase [Thermotogota bacterium]